MRYWPALTLVSAMGGLAVCAAAAGELKPLPVFFQQSWDVVKAQPLASLSAPRAVPAAKAVVPPAPPLPPVLDNVAQSPPQASVEPLAADPAASDPPPSRSIATVSIPVHSEDVDQPSPLVATLPTNIAAARSATLAAVPSAVPLSTPASAPVAAEPPPAQVSAIAPAADDAGPPVPDAAAASQPAQVATVDAPLPPERPDEAATQAKGAPVTLKVPASVRVRDQSSFMVGNTLYRLASTDGLGVDKSCKHEKGKGCFWRPMRALKQAIAGATLYCTPASGGAWSCSKRQGA